MVTSTVKSVINPPIIWSSQWSTACMILSPDASSICTNCGVHMIVLSSLHLPWLSASFAIHSYSSMGKDAKKFHGSLYISSSLTTLQFLSLSDSSDTTSDISMQISVPTMEPFVGLLGPDPGSELISQTNPCTTSPFGNSPWRMDSGLTRSSMGGCWN